MIKENCESRRYFTVPNVLTCMRIAMAPAIIFAIAKSWYGGAIFFFVCAAFTDVFDGFCARWMGQESMYGRYLDPLADKILIVSTSVALWCCTLCHAFPWWLVGVLVVREVCIVGGGFVLWLYGQDQCLRPCWLGKMTTLLFMMYLGWVLLIEVMCCECGWMLGVIEGFLCIMAVASCLKYVFRACFWYSTKIVREAK